MHSKEMIEICAINFSRILDASGFETIKPTNVTSNDVDGLWIDVARWGRGKPRIGLWYDNDESSGLGYWFGFYGTRKQIDSLEKNIDENIRLIDLTEKDLSNEEIGIIRNEMRDGTIFWIRERQDPTYDDYEYLGLYQEAIDADNENDLIRKAAEEIFYIRDLADRTQPNIAKSSSDRTERDQIIRARVGQERLCRELRKRWKGCAVTGCSIRELLRASHIKTWSDHIETRLDPANCLLLIAPLDALFDRGFISFEDDGRILISNRLSNEDKRRFAVTECLKISDPSLFNKDYMKHHRECKLKR